MIRLPTPGGDNGSWGDILNNFLLQTHNDDGSIKDGVVTKSKLSAPVQTSLDLADSAIPSSQKGASGGVASLTGTTLTPSQIPSSVVTKSVSSGDAGKAIDAYSGSPLGVESKAEIIGAPTTNLGATPSLNLSGKPHVWHLGTLNANATLSVTGFAEGYRLELHYIQDATGGRSLSIDYGSGAVPVNIPNIAGASMVVTIQWVTATEARISTPGGGLDAGTGMILWHNAGQIVADTNNVRSLLTFDAGAEVGSPTGMTKSASGITLTKQAIVIVQATMATFSNVAHAGKKISWGVYDSVVDFDFINISETIRPDGTTQGMVSWVYTPNEPDGAFPRPLRLWIAHDHTSTELWGALHVFILNPNKLAQPQGI